MTLPFVGVAARRMMPKIASSDASIALKTIACRSIPGAAIYLDRQRDDVKYRIARRRHKENREAGPLFDLPQYRRYKRLRRQSQCNQQISRFCPRTLT